MNDHAQEEVAIKECGSINFLADATLICGNPLCYSDKVEWLNKITDKTRSADTICRACGAINNVITRSEYLAEQLREAAK